MTVHSLRDIEERAGTDGRVDSIRVVDVVGRWQMLCERCSPPRVGQRFPSLHGTRSCTLEIIWINIRRTGPDTPGATRERREYNGSGSGAWFWGGCLKVCGWLDSQICDRHVVHHLQRAQEETQKDEHTVKELQTQLLKLQVGEARQRVNESKKKAPQGKQMAAGFLPEGPPPQPPGPWQGGLDGEPQLS